MPPFETQMWVEVLFPLFLGSQVAEKLLFGLLFLSANGPGEPKAYGEWTLAIAWGMDESDLEGAQGEKITVGGVGGRNMPIQASRLRSGLVQATLHWKAERGALAPLSHQQPVPGKPGSLPAA